MIPGPQIRLNSDALWYVPNNRSLRSFQSTHFDDVNSEIKRVLVLIDDLDQSTISWWSPKIAWFFKEAALLEAVKSELTKPRELFDFSCHLFRHYWDELAVLKDLAQRAINTLVAKTRAEFSVQDAASISLRRLLRIKSYLLRTLGIERNGASTFNAQRDWYFHHSAHPPDACPSSGMSSIGACLSPAL